MEDLILLDAIERYLRNEMNASEKQEFENLRVQSPEIDMMVVEHKLFLHQMENFAAHRELKHELFEIHTKLESSGEILNQNNPAPVVPLYKKYKRTIAIAASIASVTALCISMIVSYFSPSVDQSKLQQLSKDIENIKKTQVYQNHTLNQVKAVVQSKIPANAVLTGGGSAFLLDGKGYLVTNAHVLKGNSAVVADYNGKEFNADILHIDNAKDLAILKINDADFKAAKQPPYALHRGETELAEELYTLGYPKNNEIVYNRGYLSAQTGYNSDTISCQISLPANPGNSGGPVFNSNGEIIGVLSAREMQSQGVVFAVKTKEIIKLVTELKSADTSFNKLKLPAGNQLKGLSRNKQVDKVQHFIYQVKAYNAN